MQFLPEDIKKWIKDEWQDAIEKQGYTPSPEEAWRCGATMVYEKMKEEKTFTVDEIIQIIRDKMYIMESGRMPREGSNVRLYNLIYFFEHGEDDPDN